MKPLWLMAVVGIRVSRRPVSVSRLSRFKSLFPLHLPPFSTGGLSCSDAWCPLGVPGRGRCRVEELQGLALQVRREVRVPQRHLGRRVPEQFLGHERSAAHDELARERVPQVVRREPLRGPCLPAGRRSPIAVRPLLDALDEETARDV
jgi:hypothetical protein